MRLLRNPEVYHKLLADATYATILSLDLIFFQNEEDIAVTMNGERY